MAGEFEECGVRGEDDVRFAIALLILGILATGCWPTMGCLSSTQCPAGQVCMRVSPGGTDDSTDCAIPCGPELGECPAAMRCECPDSPTGGRCHIVDRPRPDGGVYFCI